MFPFWDLAIAPILDAIGARRVVEIGALRGETTTRMLERLGPDAELHVIDPVPAFDPSEHERLFPGRYRFHRDLSLNVLPTLEPMDAALIDGDHNWYTVFHEMKALADVSAANGAPLPVMILHDVGWPYGRRDLYYDPDTIPEEFRQPYAQKGISMGRSTLVNSGGLNPTMYNAIEEGGERNGVMTGVDDFVAQHLEPLEVLVLPLYFGLAIVAERSRIDSTPELKAVLDKLQSAEGRYDLLRLGEQLRLKAMAYQHSVFYQADEKLDRSARRYLSLLGRALLDEHQLENEVRIRYLLSCIQRGKPPVPAELRDPKRQRKADFQRLQAAREAGRSRDEAGDPIDAFPHTDMGRARLDHLQRCLDTVRTEKVAGDLVECGTGRGGGAIFLRGYLAAYEMRFPTVWVADRFFATGDDDTDPELGALRADLNLVRDAFERFELLDDRVRFVQGELDLTLPETPIEKIALLRIGGGLGATTASAVEALYDRLSVGGFVLMDDYADPQCAKAVDELRERLGIDEPLERVDWAGVAWRKLHAPVAPPSPTPSSSGGGVLGRLRRSRAERRAVALEGRAVGAPIPPARVAGTTALSVVVVFYNMKREAARTLHSLSRAYQEGIDDLDYEVIVVENGSDDDQRLSDEYVRSFGPEFRYIDMGAEAEPSPVAALNRGVRESRGDALALMIDGAHLLTPGVLRYGMAGLDLYAPAIVATQQWYVGPGQQGDAMYDGYDQHAEDELFEHISWPDDGYRMFEIGHFVGERDWFDGLWESNCIFAPRSLIEQVGAFDESFAVAGGGYANLELYERLGSSPDVSVTTILGEGSFHQVHGGTTTNQPEVEGRRQRITSYAEHYSEIRGRDYRGPGKPIHYVGTLFTGAVRTRARRRVAAAFYAKNQPGDPDGMPETPQPIPEELRTAYTEAFWANLAWRRTSWLGRTVGKSPSDLITYQELVNEVRPDWIVELRTGNGGRAQFLATLCEMIGHGRVLSVEDRARDNLPEHPRLQYLVAPETFGEETNRLVAEVVGEQPHGLVVLGSRGPRQRVLAEFDTYQQFVSVGSYLVVEDTIVGGHPVWPSFGAGPGEAAKQIINQHHEFVPDLTRERYTLSFNPGGYLKRVR
jgi:cephalosporin hydroxylase